MATATVRIPEKKRDILKVIASIEKREMKEILGELIDEYIARHKETLDILSRPEWVDLIEKGKAEITQGIQGKFLDELENTDDPLLHPNVRALTGKLRGDFRLRVGKYRILFTPHIQKKILYVFAIMPRGDAY